MRRICIQRVKGWGQLSKSHFECKRFFKAKTEKKCPLPSHTRKLRPPKGKWHLRIYANDKYLYHEKDGERTVIHTVEGSDKKHNINFTIPNQIKGSWGQISMFDGMLSNGAHVSIVSSEDLLYLGTYNGLSVYDGLRVQSYNYDQGLPNGYIAEIFEDSDGYIWIGYGLEGLVKWKNGIVVSYYTK